MTSDSLKKEGMHHPHPAEQPELTYHRGMARSTESPYAMVIDEFGGPEKFKRVAIDLDSDDYRPGEGEVLVKTAAIGANPLDYKMRDGSSGLSKKLALPAILGREIAGEVIAVGEGVDNLAVGDRVFGMRAMDDYRGAYATHSVFPAEGVVTTPAGLDDVTAAGLALVGITATVAVVQQAKVQSGETILIHGAGGGVGQVMTQLAVAQGARVLASASSHHHDKLVAFGAEHIDYTRENVFEAARRKCPDGVDVVLDGVYFDTFVPSLDILAPHGRIVVLPSLADVTPAKARGLEAHIPSISNDTRIYAEMASRIASGELKLPIGQVFDLSEVADVHRTLEAGHADGKIVMTV